MGGMDFYKPALAMIGLQFTYAGVALYTRAAFLRGLSPRIFVVYRQGIATLLVAPLAYVSKEGLYLSYSTIASAMTNLIPAVFSEGENWLLGCLLLLGSSFFWSFWMILQVPISATCPDLLCSSTWMCFLATLESATVAFLAGQDQEVWSLNSMLELGCCLYTELHWLCHFLFKPGGISQRGPLFAAMFNPLCTVIVTIFTALFLHEKTCIGSFLGAFAVIIGLYIVPWGKAQGLEEIRQDMDSKQVLKDESFDKKIYKIDLEEPLLS